MGHPDVQEGARRFFLLSPVSLILSARNFVALSPLLLLMPLTEGVPSPAAKAVPEEDASRVLVSVSEVVFRNEMRTREEGEGRRRKMGMSVRGPHISLSVSGSFEGGRGMWGEGSNEKDGEQVDNGTDAWSWSFASAGPSRRTLAGSFGSFVETRIYSVLNG